MSAMARPTTTAEGGLDYNVQNAVDSFEFGLPRVLDGVEAFVERRSGRGSEPPARGA